MSQRTSQRAKPATRAPRPAGRQRQLLKVRQPLSTRKFLAIAVSAFAFVFAVWQLISTLGIVDPLFLPAPSDVYRKLAALATNGTLWDDTLISVIRISIGFGIASAMAIPIGVLIGAYKPWEAAIEPLVDFVRYMPVVAFVPLTIIWVGIDDPQKWVIIWIGTFFQQVLMFMDNIKRTPQDFVHVGRTLGMHERSILTRVLMPYAAPGMWDTLRITLGWAWTYLTLAELVAATSGLGYRITVGQRFFETDLIIGYILILGLLGLITDQAMRFIGRRLFPWSED